MIRREKRDWVPLDDLTDDQRSILLRDATDWLATKAADLPTASDDDGWKAEVEEVAALGRLVSGMRRGALLRGGDMARMLAARAVSETDHLDELTEEYRRELGEHEAWAALLARFDADWDAGR